MSQSLPSTARVYIQIYLYTQSLQAIIFPPGSSDRKLENGLYAAWLPKSKKVKIKEHRIYRAFTRARLRATRARLRDCLRELGFEIVDQVKCLGMVINNRASALESHFDETIVKVRQLIGIWSRFNLSLPGRIAISKTMLVSQIGYIGCIITPTDEQLKILQSLIDTYVKSSTVIAAHRLYLKPAEGGLGLINLTSYIAALQSSWIKRCSLFINDPWRWNLAVACNFQMDLVRTDNINGTLSPICLNIAKSFSCLQNVYGKCTKNI